MKAFLLIIGTFGFAVLADGQTGPRAMPEPIKIFADSTTRTASSIQLRGNVRISDGSSVIVADEADVPHLPWTAPSIEVRGNVRITFEGPRAALVNPK